MTKPRIRVSKKICSMCGLQQSAALHKKEGRAYCWDCINGVPIEPGMYGPYTTCDTCGTEDVFNGLCKGCAGLGTISTFEIDSITEAINTMMNIRDRLTEELS